MKSLGTSTFFRLLFSIVLLSVIVVNNDAFAKPPKRYFIRPNVSAGPFPYYGREFYDHIRQGNKDQALLEELNTILISGHVPKTNGPDELVKRCDVRECYSHRPLDYDQAREILLGRIYLQKTGQSEFAITDVYCEHTYSSKDFPRGRGPAPMRIPDPRVLNTEHTWPQSRFGGRDILTQKTDLHHLFPVDSELNSIRSSFEFGEVDQPQFIQTCGQTKRGRIKGAPGTYFEPPPAHRGNVARALFYFATRYRMRISKYEEHFLKKWHNDDPVDQFEMERNEEILRIQGNRNPFIDHPELVNLVSDF